MNELKKAIEQRLSIHGLKMYKMISSGGIFSSATFDERTIYNYDQLAKLIENGFVINQDIGLWMFNAINQYKEQEKHKNALALIQTSRLKTIANIKKEAVSELVARLKINTIFGKLNKKLTNAGLQVAEELESIIDKKEIK